MPSLTSSTAGEKSIHAQETAPWDPGILGQTARPATLFGIAPRAIEAWNSLAAILRRYRSRRCVRRTTTPLFMAPPAVRLEKVTSPIRQSDGVREEACLAMEVSQNLHAINQFGMQIGSSRRGRIDRFHAQKEMRMVWFSSPLNHVLIFFEALPLMAVNVNHRLLSFSGSIMYENENQNGLSPFASQVLTFKGIRCRNCTRFRLLKSKIAKFTPFRRSAIVIFSIGAASCRAFCTCCLRK